MSGNPNMRHLRGWRIVDDSGAPTLNKYFETVFTLGNGYLGVRGALEEARMDDLHAPLTMIADVYDTPRKAFTPTRLAPVPNWLPIVFRDATGATMGNGAPIVGQQRALDMQTGVLLRSVRMRNKAGHITRIESRRIVSQARPTIAAIQYAITPENYSGTVRIESRIEGAAGYPDGVVQADVVHASHKDATLSLATRTRQSHAEIKVVARHALRCGGAEVPARIVPDTDADSAGLAFVFAVERGATYTFEKVCAIGSSQLAPGIYRHLAASVASAPPFKALERENAAVWLAYWREAGIEIEGDAMAQTMARFFVFHLLQAASLNNVRLGLSASIPARALSGVEYNGHVFWDTEIYMLPFFSNVYPEIARSLLGYRYDRLDAARTNALAARCKGAKFPWESAGTGLEVCPKLLRTADGRTVRWQGGELEIHINADVPFACWQYYLASGDDQFWRGPALDILVETARYWVSRARVCRRNGAVNYEIRDVIGPDEYNVGVNNNLYTNIMARWNLRMAQQQVEQLARGPRAELCRRLGLAADEPAQWKRVADGLVIPFNQLTGIYSQFDGFFDRTCRKLKQADVLLALWLMPELADKDMFRRNFDVYAPITLHKSSLSAGVHVLAALASGLPAEAYRYFQLTCAIDGALPEDANGNGVHGATLGAGWMAIVQGFGGIRVSHDGLHVEPRLPTRWRRLSFALRYKSALLRIALTRTAVTVASDSAKPVRTWICGVQHRIARGKPARVAFNTCSLNG